MARYRVSRKAIRDPDGIWSSIAPDNESAAERQLDRCYEVFGTLASLAPVLKGRSGISRALYVTAVVRRVVIVRVFVKKTEKTPRREIDLALSRAKSIQF